MEPWKTVLRVGPSSTQLLMTDAAGNDVLKTRLPLRTEHPRALLTLLEGLALWCGRPLVVAVAVAKPCPRSCVSTLFGDDLLPIDSALVRFNFIDPKPRRPRRIHGVGDFRQLRFMFRWDGRS